MSPILQLAWTACAGFVVSLALVPVAKRVAVALGYTAQPKEDRWHRTATPLLGGVAIAMSVLLVHLVLGDWRSLPLLLACSGLMFLVGITDDLLDLKPYAKLVAEIAIASVLVFFGYRLSWVTSLTLDTLLTTVWIVGMPNAFNLLDNMDGLCAGTAIIAGTALLATMLFSGGPTPEAMHLAVLLGAIAGFLVYNFHPASIFMGDSGSLFIGFSFAALTLVPQDGSHAPTSVLSIVAGPLLVLLLPIFDTTLVTLSRFVSGRSAAQGGRDHSSHRLVAMGLSERAAVAVLWTLAALGGALALLIQRFQNDWASIAAGLFVMLMILLAVYLAQVRVYDDATDAPLLSSGQVTPFVFKFLYKRRVAEVLLDFSLASVAYYVAYRLRYEGAEFGRFFQNFLQTLPVVVGVQMVALFLVGGYRGVWRHFGLMDGVVFAKAVVLGTATTMAIIVFGFRLESYSLSVFVIYAALLLLALMGSRGSFRLIGELAHRGRHMGQRLIIYGAGPGAAAAVRELLSQSPEGYRMVGFIADDPRMARMQMQGYPVLGDFESLVSLISNGAVDTVVITTHLVSVDRLDYLASLCEANGVSLARLPWKLESIVTVS